jgi:hypothetical protein
MDASHSSNPRMSKLHEHLGHIEGDQHVTVTTITQWRLRETWGAVAHVARRGLGVVSMTLCVVLLLNASIAKAVSTEEGLWYTMQLASFSNKDGAVRQYNALSEKLPDSLARELRLEHIPPYYVLRVGQVKTRPEMFRLSNSILQVHPQAMMVHGRVLPERILLAHTDSAQTPPAQVQTASLVVQDGGADGIFTTAHAAGELPHQANVQGQVLGSSGSPAPAAVDQGVEHVAGTDPDIILGAPRIDTQDMFKAELGRARQELAERMRPHVGLLGTLFTDRNDISLYQGGMYGRTTVLNNLDVYAQAMTGWINQQTDEGRPKSGLRRNTVELGVRQWFVTPQVVLWGGGLLEDFDLHDDGDAAPGTRLGVDKRQLWGGRIGGKYLFAGGSEVGLEGRRESIWQEHNRFDVRLFNRVVDISKMHPDMAINKLHGFVDAVTLPEHRLRVELGAEDFADDNFRHWAYAHYQIPVLRSVDKQWTVLRPNLFYESVRKDRDAYYSPDSHVTLGMMVHAIREYERLIIEGEVNPQLLWTKDHDGERSTDVGIHGLLKLSLKLGPDWRVGIGGFGYADTDDYWLLRGTGFVEYNF